MTSVYYNRKECRLQLIGHANAGEHGHDIVCAGISALWHAAKVSATERQIALMPQIKEASGDCMLILKPCREAKNILDTVINGLEALSIEFPDHIKITRIGG